MAARLPRRPTCALSLSSLSPQTTTTTSQQGPSAVQSQFQTRNARLIRRPRRPYLFTQLVQLSDGSTYTMRTASPHALYKSTKDTRNHVLWNPSEKSLKNVEVDEAGKLAAFRGRFGRSWDAPAPRVAEEDEGEAVGGGDVEGADGKKKEKKKAVRAEEEESDDPFGDLISRYAMKETEKGGKK
ncbi:hypothetical protein JX266_002344 [Neoarthrinium moseri]|nr:hypothetical protein JX266_002344 [Neoarthrinium moseri]